MVIGGETDDGSWVMDQKIYQYIKYKLSVVETEIWNFNNHNTTLIDPALPSDDYKWGIGIYLVPTGFCNNQ